MNKMNTNQNKGIYSDNFKKAYLMSSGTLFVGFASMLVANAIKKDIKPNVSLLVFISGILIGGFYTSKILKDE